MPPRGIKNPHIISNVNLRKISPPLPFLRGWIAYYHGEMGLNEAEFTFEGDLAWFLPWKLRKKTVHLTFEDHQSAKHLIESLGIPHVEVGVMRANDQEVSFSYRPKDHDRLHVIPAPLGCPMEPRFLLDNHLGRLAASLRMLGFDCLYQNDFEDAQMARLLESDVRILLTRDRQLLMRKAVKYGYCLRSLKTSEQLEEVVRRFQLIPLACPFTRCLRCNGTLEAVEKADVLDQLEPKTRRYYNEFARCTVCGKVYWRGSHWERMQGVIEKLSGQ
jgi:uncharacterized protein with PIN domain